MPSESEKNSTACSPEHLYEYALVRFVPSVEREEFINIGLIMMCKRQRWLRVQFHVDGERIGAFIPGADTDALTEQIKGFTTVAGSRQSPHPILGLEPHEKFRWLTAVRSASIQTSRPHSGLTADLDGTFDTLFSNLVLV